MINFPRPSELHSKSNTGARTLSIQELCKHETRPTELRGVDRDLRPWPKERGWERGISQFLRLGRETVYMYLWDQGQVSWGDKPPKVTAERQLRPTLPHRKPGLKVYPQTKRASLLRQLILLILSNLEKKWRNKIDPLGVITPLTLSLTRSKRINTKKQYNVVTTPSKLLVCLGRENIFDIRDYTTITDTITVAWEPILSHDFPPHPIDWSSHNHWNTQHLIEQGLIAGQIMVYHSLFGVHQFNS